MEHIFLTCVIHLFTNWLITYLFSKKICILISIQVLLPHQSIFLTQSTQFTYIWVGHPDQFVLTVKFLDMTQDFLYESTTNISLRYYSQVSLDTVAAVGLLRSKNYFRELTFHFQTHLSNIKLFIAARRSLEDML